MATVQTGMKHIAFEHSKFDGAVFLSLPTRRCSGGVASSASARVPSDTVQCRDDPAWPVQRPLATMT